MNSLAVKKWGCTEHLSESEVDLKPEQHVFVSPMTIDKNAQRERKGTAAKAESLRYLSRQVKGQLASRGSTLVRETSTLNAARYLV